jgi:hypothetical protein
MQGPAPSVRGVGGIGVLTPVILGPDGRMMDGMHRLARALLEKRTEIAAVRFATLPEPDFRDVHPDDLPYDDDPET